MRHIYELTEYGWKRVFTAQSFAHACRVCTDMQEREPHKQFCVNN